MECQRGELVPVAKALAGMHGPVVRGREHSTIIRAMKPRSGVRFTGPDKLVHLIGLSPRSSGRSRAFSAMNSSV